MTAHGIASWTALCSPLLLAAAAAAQASPVTPNATMSLVVDGTVGETIVIPAILLPDGRFRFIKDWSDGTGLAVFVNYTLDAINDPTAMVSGQCKITNASNAARSVEAAIEMNLCPEIPGGTLFGGALTLLLQTSADGGGVTCAPGAVSGWSASISGSQSQSLFYCPFQMSMTGSGSIQASTTFGTPIPSKSGPDSATSLALHHRYSITAGEIVTTTSTLVVKSMGSDTCPLDLNGDGSVNASDLGIVLGSWGQNGWCHASDLTGDGFVDGSDVGAILSFWGVCN